MATIEITPEKISRLRYVNTEHLKPGRYNFPDFFLIGPQRTGTGWLHKNLCFHPEIFMPPNKELFYFNKLLTKSGDNYTSDRLDWYLAHFNPSLWSILKQSASIYKSSRTMPPLEQSMRKLGNACLKGEATASYAVMPEPLVEEIVTLNPEVKAVMLIRHPYDRAWSHAKKDLLRQRKRIFAEVPFNEFKAFYARDHQLRCGGYTEILRKWESLVGGQRLFVGFYDEIKRRPEELLTRVFSFLGVAAEARYINDLLARAVIAKTRTESVPEAHREYLAGHFAEEIQRLNERFDLHWC